MITLRRLLSAGLLVLSIWGSSGVLVQADGAGPVRYVTQVQKVQPYNSRSSASWCRIHLANGRTLEMVYGRECQARPGQTVLLWYVTQCRPLLGCRQVLWMWQLLP